MTLPIHLEFYGIPEVTLSCSGGNATYFLFVELTMRTDISSLAGHRNYNVYICKS